ncbi:MAG: zinc-ribbon domain-containing protein [Candidatus Heimdallarchaeota archaeon]
MSEQFIVLKGKVKEFTRSESGNLAFMFEDKNGDIRYCFSPTKKPFINISDELVIIGSLISGAKVRINYIINNTKNSEENLIEPKSDWTYYVSLIFAILVTLGLIIAVLFLTGIIPIGGDSIWDPINTIFSMVISLVMVILFVPLMIILWVLTIVFSKKKKSGLELENEVLRIKKEIYGVEKTTQTTVISEQAPIEYEEEKNIPKGKYCSHCGEKLPYEAKFCPKCGSKW